MSATISNQLIQNQNMSLTPKMIVELKILHMSSIELLQYIGEALVENPLLEVDKDDEDELRVERLLKIGNEYRENNDTDGIDQDESETDLTEIVSGNTSLRQYLLSQICELKINLQYKRIAEYIIDSIDEKGYFRESIDDVAFAFGISVHRVMEALKLVQFLEPAGIGARNLEECILLQLERKNILTSQMKCIINNHLEELGKRKYKEIATKLDITEEQVKNIHQLIRSVNPKPGLQYADGETSYIIPELFVQEIDGKYETMFLDDRIPALRINSYYKSLMKNGVCDLETNKYIKSKVVKSIEIIHAIEQRKRTILNTANFIVQYQEDFFRKGYEYLKPMTMKMVADEINLHESTISRTVNHKYIQTIKGTFELKFFFSSGIEADRGNNISSQGVKDIIRRIILEEDKKKPLSDIGIMKTLEEKGIIIARRTVAKYREVLLIPPASMRKI